MEAVIQISEVNSKDVNTSRGVSTVYNIKAQDGKEFSTFKKDLGQQAGQLRGQWATVEYTEVQKGKYTNYYLDGVAPFAGDTKAAEGLTTLPSHTGVVDQPSNPAGTVGTFSAPGVTHNISQKPAEQRYRTPEQILREGALKAAVDTAVGLQMADANVRDIINIARGYEAWITEGEKDVAPFETMNQSSGDVDEASLVDF